MDIEQILAKVQKPAYYCGGEYNEVIKDKNNVDIRFAFCFPDLYSVGMSNLGLKILYHMMNERNDTWCERVFVPDTDMQDILRSTETPLFAIESRDAVRDFDIVGFSLGYELGYTNILTVLDLAGIPFFAEDRDDSFPVIVAGGTCCHNPAPISRFFDLLMVGEGEEMLNELLDTYKASGSKDEFLRNAASIEGVYVPKYSQGKVRRRILSNFSDAYYPTKMIVPNTEIIHDRIMLEIMRGCIRGCRFCQAGTLYRPYRQRSRERLVELAKDLYRNTGCDEISLMSLSTSDYQDLCPLADDLLDFCIPNKVDLAVPSLRVDNLTPELVSKISAVRSSGLTLAPEAGTQRLRDVINKNVTEQDIENACKAAFEGGANSVKLYFMIGLPTETDEDILGINETAMNVIRYFHMYTTNKSRGIRVTISLSTFIPKPFTPFQWEEQISTEETDRRQQLLRSAIKSHKIVLNYHEKKVSALEGVFSRGDDRLCNVLVSAWEKGCQFDAWDEHFKFDKWCEALEENGLTFDEYMSSKDTSSVLPWNMIDSGVSEAFLLRERQNAYEGRTTPNCAQKCSGCGVSRYCKGDVCI